MLKHQFYSAVWDAYINLSGTQEVAGQPLLFSGLFSSSTGNITVLHFQKIFKGLFEFWNIDVSKNLNDFRKVTFKALEKENCFILFVAVNSIHI